MNFFNNSQLVEIGFTYIHLNHLHPYEKTCFSILVDNPPAWTSYSFEPITFQTSSTARPHLTVTSKSGGIYSGYYRILGQVRNDDGKPVTNGSVIATLYSATGVSIGCNVDYLNNNNLAANQTSSFEIHSYPPVPANVSTYTLQTDGSH